MMSLNQLAMTTCHFFSNTVDKENALNGFSRNVEAITDNDRFEIWEDYIYYLDNWILFSWDLRLFLVIISLSLFFIFKTVIFYVYSS